jgi:hypothetical protein
MSTQEHAGRHYFAPYKQTGEIRDRSQYSESRPGAKEKIRNAKRAMKKSTRQRVKVIIRKELNEDQEEEGSVEG